MPITPFIYKTIGAIRKSMASWAGKKDADPNLYLLIDQLFRKPAWIVGGSDDAEEE